MQCRPERPACQVIPALSHGQVDCINANACFRPEAAVECISSAAKQAVYVVLVAIRYEVTDLGYDSICDVVLDYEALKIRRECGRRFVVILAKSDTNRV